jgi:hypothetical protein
MISDEDRYDYYLKSNWETDWTKVSKETFIKAERSAGFKPKVSSDSPEYWTTLATSGFSGGSCSGMIKVAKRIEK